MRMRSLVGWSEMDNSWPFRDRYRLNDSLNRFSINYSFSKSTTPVIEYVRLIIQIREKKNQTQFWWPVPLLFFLRLFPFFLFLFMFFFLFLFMLFAPLWSLFKILTPWSAREVNLLILQLLSISLDQLRGLLSLRRFGTCGAHINARWGSLLSARAHL